jgi:DNA-binding Xre family transcriptional regulator
MIRNKVAQYFDAHDITIASAHHLTKISRSSLTRLYRNEVVNVNFDTLDAIGQAYKCKIEDLIEIIPDEEMTVEDKQQIAQRKLHVEYYTKIRRKNQIKKLEEAKNEATEE